MEHRNNLYKIRSLLFIINLSHLYLNKCVALENYNKQSAPLVYNY